MHLKLKRWGNSQGIIIPKKILEELDMPFEGDFDVEVEYDSAEADGKLVLTPNTLKRVVIVCEKPTTAHYFEQMVERFGEDLPFNVAGVISIKPNVNPFEVAYNNNFDLTNIVNQIKDDPKSILKFVGGNNIVRIEKEFADFKQQLNDLQPDFIINGATFGVDTFIVQTLLTLAGYNCKQVKIAKFEDCLNTTLFNAMFHTAKATRYFDKNGELINDDLLKEIKYDQKRYVEYKNQGII